MKRRPWPLLTSIALLGLLSVAQVVTALLLAARELEHPVGNGAAGLFVLGALVSVAINLGLMIGLAFCKSWARWLTIVRLLLGAVWTFYDLSEAAQGAGGLDYLPNAVVYGAYAFGALAALTALLLLFPSVTDACEGRWEPSTVE